MDKTGLFSEKGIELNLTEVVTSLNFNSISRIELIDKVGRQYVRRNSELQVKLIVQDEDQTLKVVVLDSESPAYDK